MEVEPKQIFDTQQRWHRAETDVGRDVVAEVCSTYGSDLNELRVGPFEVIALLVEAEADWEMAVVAVLKALVLEFV